MNFPPEREIHAVCFLGKPFGLGGILALMVSFLGCCPRLLWGAPLALGFLAFVEGTLDCLQNAFGVGFSGVAGTRVATGVATLR